MTVYEAKQALQAAWDTYVATVYRIANSCRPQMIRHCRTARRSFRSGDRTWTILSTDNEPVASAEIPKPLRRLLSTEIRGMPRRNLGSLMRGYTAEAPDPE